MIVRLATPEDAPRIFDLLKLMHAEVGLAPLNPEKAVGALVAAIDGGFVLVADRDGVLVGSVGLVVDRWWYSDGRLLRDLWTFVHPDHRRSRAAALLIAHARETAKIVGLPLLLGVTAEDDVRRKIAFFARRMRPIGAFFYDERE